LPVSYLESDRRSKIRSYCQGGIAMLVLTRKPGEQIVIDDSIVVTVLGLHGNRVRIGIRAPQSVAIQREELLDKNREVVSQKRMDANLLGAS
jgi:carbon storage regulator